MAQLNKYISVRRGRKWEENREMAYTPLSGFEDIVKKFFIFIFLRSRSEREIVSI